MIDPVIANGQPIRGTAAWRVYRAFIEQPGGTIEIHAGEVQDCVIALGLDLKHKLVSPIVSKVEAVEPNALLKFPTNELRAFFDHCLASAR